MSLPDEHDRHVFLDIYRAARKGDADRVAKLLELDRELINCKFTNGCTPLIWACRLTGMKDAAALLIKSGADIEARNDFGATALCESAEKDLRETAELLINSEANPNESDSAGNTAIMLAARQGHHEMMQLLWRCVHSDHGCVVYGPGP
jgi:ankyrin repeat protein